MTQKIFLFSFYTALFFTKEFFFDLPPPLVALVLDFLTGPPLDI